MKTIVITGATSGFGQLLVRKFLSAGDRVIASGRNLKSRPEILKAEREMAGTRLIETNLDVTDSEGRKAFKLLCESLGSIDVLINNAGFGLFGPLEECEEDQIRYQMEVNFFGTALVTRDLLPLIRKARGKIFNFSSVFGLIGFPLTSLYCASKFAVEGFSESLAYELAPHGVQVCSVEPGGYRTKFGQNIVWGRQPNPTGSVYHRQTENYKILRDKMMTKPNFQDPQEVADGVFKLAGQSKIPIRVAFGKDAFFTKVMKGWIPEFLFHSMAKRMMTKIFTRPLEINS